MLCVNILSLQSPNGCSAYDNDINVTQEAGEPKHDSDKESGDTKLCLQSTFVQKN